ncbi:MAG: T9SS type A sorting domain-containing protein [Bacteroidetes bacterium]|nr:T9SS type A sorting domain-containing protein [Bacteroidota bacterium]
MKKIYSAYLLSLFFSSLFISSFSQTYQRTYGSTGSETGSCIQKTLDGNYIISGRTNSFSAKQDLDYYLVKIDPQGNILWSKTYGGTGNDIPYYLYTCTDGGFIMTGSKDICGTGGCKDMYLVRTDSDGNLLWSTTIGGTGDELGWYVIQTSDGGFVSTGSTTTYAANPTYDGYLVKVNSAGMLLWTKVFDGSGATFLYSVSGTSDGGYIVTGETSANSFGSSDNLLIKTDSNGDTLWVKQIGKVTEESANAGYQTGDGGYIVVGDVHVNNAVGAHHISIMKTDSDGNLLWNRAYGSSPGSEIAYDVKPAPNNGYYVFGETGFYGAGGKDFLLAQTDSIGIITWAKTYGGTAMDDPWFFQVTSDGGMMLAGGTASFGIGYFDFYLVKTDSVGSTQCFNLPCSPELDLPVLQTRSGFTVLSGGAQSFPATTVTIDSTLTFDPCTLVGMNEIYSEEEIQVFPNPSNGQFTVYGLRSTVELSIYDVLGNKVFYKTLNGKQETVNMSGAGRGIYFYKLESSDGKIATGKLIVE